jgi:hypothetical protein
MCEAEATLARLPFRINKQAHFLVAYKMLIYIYLLSEILQKTTTANIEILVLSCLYTKFYTQYYLITRHPIYQLYIQVPALKYPSMSCNLDISLPEFLP